MIKLPTDNLYKFIAISGLIILINSGYYIYSFNKELFANLNSATNIVKQNIADSNALWDNVRKLKEKLQAEHDPTIVKNIENEIKSLEEKSKKYINNQDAKKILQDIDDKTNTGTFSNIVYNVVVFTFFFGTIIMLSGFICWYLLVQKYQDKILKSDANQQKNTRIIIRRCCMRNIKKQSFPLKKQ